MNERIRKLRKLLDLTQQEFGKRIGMKQNTIALIEGGRNTSDQTIIAICKEYNVNETWLRTGQGEMFLPKQIDIIDNLAKEYNLEPEIQIFIRNLIQLPASEQEAVVHLMTKTAADLMKYEEDKEEEDIESKVEAYRRSLIEEREAKEKSEVS